ncbi:MAG: PAS domain S-box protein [Bacteroidetes bacterium]|nr:PAS domain S-box protein [Bacteroidota bacterium]
MSTDFMIKHTYGIIKQVENIKSSVAESEAAERAYLLTGKEQWKESLKEAQTKTVQALSEVMSQVKDSHQKEHLRELEKVIHRKIIYENSLVNDEKIVEKQPGIVNYGEQGNQIKTNIQSLLDEFMTRQNQLLQQRSEANADSKTKALTVAIAGMGLFFLFITATLVRLNRDISRRKHAENEIRNSEKKYRRLIEDAGVTMFTSNKEGLFTYVSGKAQTLTGYTADELTGKSFTTLVRPEWIEKVILQYQQQVKEGKPESTIEFPIVTKEGKVKWVEQQAVLLFDDVQDFAGYQCVVKDITEKKEADIQLKKSEQLMQSVLNNTREGFFMINRDYELLLVNRQAKEGMEMISGKPLAVGMNLIDFVVESEQKQAVENLEKVFKGELVNHEAKYDTPGGPQWIRISHSPVRDDKGMIIGAALVTHDITEKRKQEEYIRESEYKFRTTLERLGDNVWEHDFRTSETYFSKTAFDFLGYSPTDFTNNVNLWWECTHKDDRWLLEENDRKYKAGLSDRHALEYRMICKNGAMKWVLDRGVVIDKSADGKPLRILGTHTDITNLKITEEKLRDSDQKIRAMLESTKEGFFMIGHDYSIMMMNEVGSRSITTPTGKKGNLGDNILDYILPERKESFIKIFRKVMEGGLEETEVPADTPEGKKWYHNSYFPVRNARNEIIGICTSSKDITEKKLVDNALAKIRAEREEYQYRLQSILDNTPLIVFVKDLEGRYLFANKAFLELLNLKDTDVIGKTDFDITSEELAREYKKVDDEVISTLRSLEREETIYNVNGGRNLLLTKFPLFDRKNNIYGVSGIATDFTDKVQYRQKLIEAKKKAEHAEQLQEQFLANMSHEIRTPMNGIIGMTNVLMGTPLDEEQKEFVNIIKQSSDNLLFLINDILDLSKIKSGKLSLEHIRFNLREILDTTLAPFYIKAKEKSVELILMQDITIPQQLEGDPYRLNQILNNLLSNALKFTEKGSVKLSIGKLNQSEKEVTLQFSVEDTGIGIPEEKIQNIFNSFEQASSSTARKFGGTGLGLAITRQLVEMQAGKIEVKSVAGSGTVFEVTIKYPYAKQKNTKEFLPEVNPNNNNKVLKGKRILVAEDNEINQKVILNILKKEEIITVIADNGREAVNRLEEGEKFDLIILDMQMPEMDGFQTATYIRKKLLMNTPIIAMTASALRNEKMKCFELGMNEYLTKPFSPAELFKHLRRFLLAQNSVQPPLRQVTKSESELYNLSHLYEMEDNEYFCEILQLFLDTTPTGLQEIKEAALYENWQLVYKKAHKMKSSLGILQMNSMLELITAIESSARFEKETELIPEKLKQVTELFELVRPIIETELNNAKAMGIS